MNIQNLESISLFPPCIGIQYLEDLAYQAELEEYGIVCINCGEKHMPQEMIGEVCENCFLENFSKEESEFLQEMYEKYLMEKEYFNSLR
ncbi:MAG: hypothetical protein HUJ68_10380 [Clostridia bacterium]|nr:hypothetical protein [Clostridia bacterium]